MKTGDEPVHARSPLRLRLVLASFGLLCAIVGAVLFTGFGFTAGVVACAVLGLIAVTDLVVVIVRMRQGPHYQPGRSVPPYSPVTRPRRDPRDHDKEV
jgi:hypothetical protein